MQQLRILLAPSAYYPHVGGIEELTRQLALILDSRGHTVSVLTNRWPAGVARQEVLDDVQVARLPFPLPASRPREAATFLLAGPAAALRLAGHLRQTKPDVVHVIGAGPQSVYLAAICPLLGIPLVFTAQGELGFDAQNVFERSTTLRAGLRRMLRVADAVTACSTFVLDELRPIGRIAADAVVVPNGVNPSDFDDNRPTGERPYVLGVGRLVPQKGFDVLVDAFASPDLCELELVIAGDGAERDRLERRAAAAGLSSRVRFVGAVDRTELRALLAGAAVFVMPSRGEPFGIALLEAMAAGVPAVATVTGGIKDFARNEHNALLVEPDDPDALHAAIKRIGEDREFRDTLVTAGRTTAESLSWHAIAPRYESLYRFAAPAAGRS